jgi:hypothetical protein
VPAVKLSMGPTLFANKKPMVARSPVAVPQLLRTKLYDDRFVVIASLGLERCPTSFTAGRLRAPIPPSDPGNQAGRIAAVVDDRWVGRSKSLAVEIPREKPGAAQSCVRDDVRGGRSLLALALPMAGTGA